MLPSISRMKSSCSNSTSARRPTIPTADSSDSDPTDLFPISNIRKTGIKFKCLQFRFLKMRTIPFYVVLAVLLLQGLASAGNCTVCGKCVACGPDVLGDGYLDDIDALMQAKVQSLGYPLGIARNATPAAIIYNIQYSSGLLIVLQLTLANMQIQLLSYSINSAPVPPSPPPASAPTLKTTPDGYYILTDFETSKQVSEIMTYLESVVKSGFTNFQLVSVQFNNASALLYRLSFKVLPVSSALTSVLETVLVQYIGTNNCLLIDSNYSALPANASWTAVDNKAILSDPFIAAINSLLLTKYANLLGKSPTIVSLALGLPYYQLVYQVDSTNYSFVILYDYFQNRILQGNLTTSKAVTTYTQTATPSALPTSTQTTQSSSSSQTVQTSNSVSSGSNVVVSGPNAAAGGSMVTVNAPVSTVSPSVAGAQAYYTVTTSSSTSQGQTTPTTQATISSASGSSSSTSTASTTSTTSTATTTSTTSTSSKPVSSSSSSTGQSSSSSSSSSTAFNSGVAPVLSGTSSNSYQQIINFQSNAEAVSALAYLVSIGQNISMGQVQSVQKMTNGSTVSYLITVQITSLGSVTIKKSVFYQYVLQAGSSGSYFLAQAAYTGLSPPNFAALTLEEVKKDDNIKIIARYLLSQQFPMLSSNSQVLAVFRDIPYYQIVFQGAANMQLTFIILYALNGTVQVMSATSKQVAPPQQTYAQAAAEAAANGQTSLSTQTVQTTQNSQTTQTSTQTQTSQNTQTSQGQQAQSSLVINASPATQATQTTTTTSQTTQPSTQQTSQQASQATQAQTSQVSQSSQSSQASQSTQTQTASQVQTSQPTVQPVLQQSTTTTSQQTANSNQQTATSTASQSSEPVFVQIKQVQSNTTATQPATQQNQPQAATTTTSAAAQNSTTSTQSTPASTSTVSTNPSTTTSAQTASQTTTSSSSSTSSASSGSSGTSGSLSGFNHFAGPSDQFYSYNVQGMNQINQTLFSKGYSAAQISYKDIVYKLEGNVLTILFKVEAGGLIFTYQYKGSLGSAYQLTSQQPSAIQTSSDTGNYAADSNVIVSGGVTYQSAPSSLIGQAYIQSYLNFLASTDTCYSRSNLVGIYVNPLSPKTIFFRFRNSTQYYNIVTNTVEIQRILAIYLSDSNPQPALQQPTTPASTSSSSLSSSQASQANQTVSTQNTQTSTSTSQTSTQTATVTSQTSNQSSSQAQTAQTQAQAAQTQTQTAQAGSQQSQIAQSSQPSQSQSQTQSQSQASQSQSQTTQTTIFQNAQAIQTAQTSQTSQATQSQSAQTVQTAPIKASQVITITNVDPHCLCYDQSRCLKCAHRYYLSNNHCIQVPNECLSYDINTGVCVKCLPGYSLVNGLCQLDDVTAYYYEGQCFQCLGDYRLVNRRCVYAPPTDPKSAQFLQTKNPLCLSWNNGKCDECLPGTFLSTRQVCELVDPLCSLFDYAREACNTCLDGYVLRNGKCYPA